MNAWAWNIEANRVAGIRRIDRFAQSAIGRITDAVVMIVGSINSEGRSEGSRLDCVADAVRQVAPQPKPSGEHECSENRGR